MFWAHEACRLGASRRGATVNISSKVGHGFHITALFEAIYYDKRFVEPCLSSKGLIFTVAHVLEDGCQSLLPLLAIPAPGTCVIPNYGDDRYSSVAPRVGRERMPHLRAAGGVSSHVKMNDNKSGSKNRSENTRKGNSKAE